MRRESHRDAITTPHGANWRADALETKRGESAMRMQARVDPPMCLPSSHVSKRMPPHPDTKSGAGVLRSRAS